MPRKKNAAEVHCATSGLSKEVFVSRYLIELPSKQELSQWLAQERGLIEQSQLEH